MGRAARAATLFTSAAALAGGIVWLIRASKRRLAARARRVSEAHDRDPLPPSDPIDEASWESFPASDAPARTTPLR